MKSTILTLSALFIFIGCSGSQPSPEIQDSNINKKENIKQVKKESQKKNMKKQFHIKILL